MKRKVAVLLIFAMAVSMLGGCTSKKNYECSVEMGENYVFDATKIFGVSEKEAKDYVANLTTLDTTKEGVYEVTVKNGKEEFTVKYTVKDTKDPVVIVKSQALFTKNIDNPDLTGIVEVRDGSECTYKLCKFKKLEDVRVVDEKTLAYYTESIKTQTTEELLKRTDELPDSDGIYSAVLLVEDAYRHKVAVELIVIYDTQAPVVGGTEELVTDITVDDLSVPWTDNLVGNLSVIDNVDGIISPSMMQIEMKPVTNDNTKYDVKAEYTDRAGNQAGTSYTITLKEKEKPQTNTGNETGNGGSNTGNGGGNGSTSNGGTQSGGANTSQGGTNTGGGQTNSNPGYSYEDRDGDGFADLGEYTEMNGYIVRTVDVDKGWAEFMLALSYAGLYNIIYDEYYGGSYGVLVASVDEEELAIKMLKEHLASMGLGWHSMSGSWFDRENKAYRMLVFGSQIYELPPQPDPDEIPDGVLNDPPED